MMMDSIDTDFYLFIYLINSVFKTMIMFLVTNYPIGPSSLFLISF